MAFGSSPPNPNIPNFVNGFKNTAGSASQTPTESPSVSTSNQTDPPMVSPAPIVSATPSDLFGPNNPYLPDIVSVVSPPPNVSTTPPDDSNNMPVESMAPPSPAPAPPDDYKPSDSLKQRTDNMKKLPFDGQFSSDGVNSQKIGDVIVSTPKPGKEDKIGLNNNGNPVILIGDKFIPVSGNTKEDLKKALIENGVDPKKAQEIVDKVVKQNANYYTS